MVVNPARFINPGSLRNPGFKDVAIQESGKELASSVSDDTTG
jgi:hypothetical protein